MSTSLIAPENDYRSLMGEEVENPDLHVTVVIPVYNRVDLLERTLAGILNQTYPKSLLSVVVADDGSTEDVPGAVAGVGRDLDVSVVRREHSGYGAGQARNLGAVAAEGSQVLVFFDADCVPDHEAIQRHAIWHHLADNLVVIGSRHQVDTSSIPPEEISTGRISLREMVFDDAVPPKSSWASQDFRGILHRRTASLRRGDMGFRSLVSSNFSVRREFFMSTGGFSEDFTRWGGEDTELGWRLWNDGAFFIDEPRAAIYHQTQEDTGEEGWREQSRAANEGLILSKIPHRHYRAAGVNVINETPKVSVVIHGVDVRRLDELTNQVLAQRLADLTVILTGDDPETVAFLERRSSDPRFLGAPTVEDAVRRSCGEFVALVHGATAIDHRLLSRSVSAIERRPDFGWVRSAYGVPTTDGLEVYGTERDCSEMDRAWSGRLPIFGLTRRRELLKCIRAGYSVEEAWEWVAQELEPAAHRTPLVLVPGPARRDDLPLSIRPPTTLRSMVLADLKAGGRRAAKAPIRAVRAAVTGAPYRETTVEPAQPEKPRGGEKPTIRYVGWTGRNNLGDEAMLKAFADLFSWAEVKPDGNPGELLVLGGGTLINRGYLRHLRPLDSPRVERIVFGTGVANPSYWGEPREKPADWIDFLDSCLYVGLRGPISAEILADWGLSADFEIIGDPALALRPSPVEKVDGRVIFCPAWARGLLWGESDSEVISAFSRTIKKLRDTGHEVWALSAFPGDDSHIIDMMREAGEPDLPYLAAHDDPRAALDLLASADLVVSERLHGAVLAAAAGTVPVMVEYRPKLRDFAESLGIADLVIRTDALGGDALAELVISTLQRREELLDPMMERVDSYRSRQIAAASSVHRSLTE